MSQKSYDNTPTLYIVPTPIGNMEDITYRAINTLKEVDVIFAEDTRVTKQLLNHFNINKKSCFDYQLLGDQKREEEVELNFINQISEIYNIDVITL